MVCALAALMAPAALCAQPIERAPEGEAGAVRVSLSDAVARATARNPTARIAQAEARRAQALMEQARAASLPTLTGNAVYTRLDDDRVLSGRVIAGGDQLSANLTLTVPLVVPQRWASWSHASDNVDTAQASALETRWQVAATTARAWLSVLAQHRVIETLTRARDAARAHRDFSHARLAGGVGNRIDEIRAGQELASTEAQLAASGTSLARTQEALGVLLGADGAVDVEHAPTLDAGSDVQSEARALADAQAMRPDIRTARARVEATGHLVRDGWTDYLPSLLGVAQPFYQNPPTLTQPLVGWQAQLVLSIPFYDGGLRDGARHERRALADEAQIQLDNAQRQARADVRTAIAAIGCADRALDAARDATRLAEEALALAQTAYRSGVSTNLEVIDAERRARDAATSMVVAEDAARQARLDLLIASGRMP